MTRAGIRAFAVAVIASGLACDSARDHRPWLQNSARENPDAAKPYSLQARTAPSMMPVELGSTDAGDGVSGFLTVERGGPDAEPVCFLYLSVSSWKRWPHMVAEGPADWIIDGAPRPLRLDDSRPIDESLSRTRLDPPLAWLGYIEDAKLRIERDVVSELARAHRLAMR